MNREIQKTPGIGQRKRFSTQDEEAADLMRNHESEAGVLEGTELGTFHEASGEDGTAPSGNKSSSLAPFKQKSVELLKSQIKILQSQSSRFQKKIDSLVLKNYELSQANKFYAENLIRVRKTLTDKAKELESTRDKAQKEESSKGKKNSSMSQSVTGTTLYKSDLQTRRTTKPRKLSGNEKRSPSPLNDK